MKNLLSTLAASLLAATPAFAGPTLVERDYSKEMTVPTTETQFGTGFYFAIFGGANVHQDADIDDFDVEAGGLDFDINADLDPDTGWFAGVKAGYTWDTGGPFMPGVELEAFYNTVDVNIDVWADELRSDARASGELRSGVIMLNLLGRIDLGRFRPYIGAGIGAAYIEAGQVRAQVRVRGEEILDVEADADDIDRIADIDSEGWTGAWQGIAGFDYYISDRWSIFAEYKALWFWADTDELSHYLQHLVGGGFRFHF